MVAVESTPAESGFAHVAGADNQTAGCVGDVKEDLCAFTGLCIFVSDIFNGWVVSNILKMLQNGGLDGNIAVFAAQCGNETQGVVVGAVGGAEARHGDANEILCRQFQTLQGFLANQKSQCGIQTAGNADHQLAQTGVGHSVSKTLNLQFKEMVKVAFLLLTVGRQIWGFVDGAQQLVRMIGGFNGEGTAFFQRITLLGADDLAVNVTGKNRAVKSAVCTAHKASTFINFAESFVEHRTGGIAAAAVAEHQRDAVSLRESLSTEGRGGEGLGSNRGVAWADDALSTACSGLRKNGSQVSQFARTDGEGHIIDAENAVRREQMVETFRNIFTRNVAQDASLREHSVYFVRNTVHHFQAAGENIAAVFFTFLHEKLQRFFTFICNAGILQQTAAAWRAECHAWEHNDVAGGILSLTKQVQKLLAAEGWIAGFHTIDHGGDSKDRVHKHSSNI